MVSHIYSLSAQIRMFFNLARFGVPTIITITSDRGTQVTSEIWAELCISLGIQDSATTAYHPQSNGMIERSYIQLKDALQS